MATDSNLRFIPPSRVLVSGVTLYPNGQLSAATKAAVKAIPVDLRNDGMEVVVAADRTRWIFNATSTAADTTDTLVMTPSVGSGRWIRGERAVHLKLAIDFSTADAAVLFTVPTGFRLYIERVFWEVTADFTGGSSSTIGVSSSQSPYNTKGDLAGAAAGAAAAALTAGIRPGGTSPGTDFGSNGVILLEAASTIRHDLITSQFTAGTGFVHVLGRTIV